MAYTKKRSSSNDGGDLWVNIPVQPPYTSCIDGDGADVYTKGTTSGYDSTSGKYVTATDECEGPSTINEYVCEGIFGTEVEFDCPKGCALGACVAV